MLGIGLFLSDGSLVLGGGGIDLGGEMEMEMETVLFSNMSVAVV